MLSHFAAKSAKAVVLGLAGLSLLSIVPSAKAGVLNFYIFDNPANSGNASVKIAGSLDSPSATTAATNTCVTSGAGDLYLSSALLSQYFNVCAVQALAPVTQQLYTLTPQGYGTFTANLTGFSNGVISGSNDVFLDTNEPGGPFTLNLDSSYIAGSQINTSINFASPLSAANNGPIVGNGLIGSFTIGTQDIVSVYLSNPPTPPSGTSVPTPLPILGASAAFGWARRMRRRVSVAA